MPLVRDLIVILGDQLDAGSGLLRAADRSQDAVWMAEVAEESTHVWSHKARIALFLSAMRHFEVSLRRLGLRVFYTRLDQPDNQGSLARQLAQDLRRLRPARVRMTEPGDWRVREQLQRELEASGIPWEVCPDEHFYCPVEEFRSFARGKRRLRLEQFYRRMRRRHQVLMDGVSPAGGVWNYDGENRGAFPPEGPGRLPAPLRFPPDEITREVIGLVEERFGSHPGSLADFDWPVTSSQAEQALEDFVRNRLPSFGRFQDAMWQAEPWLYHSRLSAALNLKLLNPRRAVERAEQAWRKGEAPLASVEGFIRQILGWREYVRGIYWTMMPEYAQRNALQASQPLPQFYWTGRTDMNCLRQALAQTLRYGYAHHIQRLMVTGLFSLLLGVQPAAIHEWYLAIYVDAVEWVELPNVIGMSQFADGGYMASKPYVASGKYIQRMSNYCDNCRYNPSRAEGENACPFTTLYWDFLFRHQDQLRRNPRMVMQTRNLARIDAGRRQKILQQANAIRQRLAEGESQL